MLEILIKNQNMKLLSTATLVTTLFTFVAADGNFSKMELHQRALKAFSARKSHAFSRQLEVSAECMTNQEELELTGVNENDDLIDDDQLMDICEIDVLEGGSIMVECDYTDIFAIDSATCASAGGQIIRVNMEMDCEGLIANYINIPVCLHTTCDADAYVETMEDMLEMGEGDDLTMGDCYFDISISGSMPTANTAAPTSAPTFSPDDCPAGQSEVVVNIMTDIYPEETAWAIVDIATGENVEKVSTFSMTEANTLYTTDLCLPLLSKCYLFVILDYFQDGFITGGYYSLDADDELHQEDFTSDFLTHTFGDCGEELGEQNYSFVQGKDSHGNDIERYWFEGITIDEMKSRCDANVECLGFNSNGWMKYHLKPENEWNHWTNDPNKGFYIKD
jgi:hypothetical protein